MTSGNGAHLRAGAGVAAALVLALALRVPFLADPLEPDEAGYLLVARQWHLLDPQLYGAFWVDRPPLLLLLFQAADALGAHGVRLLGLAAVTVLVVAAGAAGALVAGRRGGAAAATVAGALASSYALGGQEVDGELLGIPLVMACCGLTLLAARSPHPRRRVAVGVAAGLAGAGAVLVKQNLFDGLVFAAALLAATALLRGPSRRSAVQLLGAGLAGVLLVGAAVVTWTQLSGVSLGTLAYTVYGFRVEAAEVIGRQDASAPEQRAVLLGAAAVASGLLVVLALAARRAATHVRHREPFAVAVLVTMLYGVAGVVAGGSYWTHYLLELVPVAALGTALLVRDRRDGLRASWIRPAIVLAVCSAIATGAAGAVLGARTGQPEATAATTGAWLQRASHPGDTLLVTYGHANLVLDARLPAAYPYLWSLPLRARDPELSLLTGTLRGPRAPTWLVEWDSFESWHLDEGHQLATVVRRRYRPVATVCGHPVFLRDDARRTVPARTVAAPCGEL